MMRSRLPISLAALAAPVLMLLFSAACSMAPAQRKPILVAKAEKYQAAGEYGKAIIEYKNALQLEPGSAELYYKLGGAYAQNGQLREAFLAYGKAVELNPGFAPAQMAQARFYLA